MTDALDLSQSDKDENLRLLQGELKRVETALWKSLTEKTTLQQELELAKQLVEAANRSRNDFLARLSREILAPINLIVAMNTRLLESPLEGEQKEQVEASDADVRRLLHLVNRILDFSKLAAGQLALEKVPFDLNEVLHSCAAAVAPAIEQKGLTFETLTNPSTPKDWIGDGERLKQVLMNLFDNAIKFTAQGSIELRVGPEVGARGEKGLRFELDDTGCGIPCGKAKTIFDAFQNVAGHTSQPSKGTGLGLATAHALVEKMGGRIWLTEKADPGAQFVFTVFPQLAASRGTEDKAASTATSAARSPEAGTRVLLVEDNPENMALLQAHLADRSLLLDFAENGLEAVEKRQRGDYHLVLMDIQMPVMDGLAATREIRAWEKSASRPRVPIVALTAHAFKGAHAASIAAGCDGHLTKPVEQKDLVETIAKFAPSSTSRSDTVARLTVSRLVEARRPAFLANRRIDLEKMRQALAGNEFKVIQAIGHNCKGIGTSYGFPEISQIGAAIENAAQALDAHQLEEAIERFERTLVAAAGSGRS